MTLTSPPKNLPKAFLEIWNLLADEETVVGSRQKLAKKLRISTGTLQRILVSGNIPDFHSITNNRILNSWAKTVRRIAGYFDKNPEHWLLETGLPLVKPTRKPRAPAATVKTAGLDLRPVLQSLERLGIADFEPFSIPIPRYRYSFFEEFALRLTGAVLPDVKPRFQSMDSLEILEELAHPDPFFTIGIGALVSTSRMKNGIEFIEIPALRIRLSAIYLHSTDDSGPLIRFLDAIDPADPGGPLFIVTAGAVTHDFLAGQCRIPDDRILIRSPEVCSDPVTLLMNETRRYLNRPVIMMAAENQCINMQTAFANREVDSGYRIEIPEHEASDFPSYPVGIVFHKSATRLMPLFRSALELELFGSCLKQTARLYAGLVEADIRRHLKDTRIFPKYRHSVHLVPGQLAGPEFQAEFFRALDLFSREASLPGSVHSRNFFSSASPVETASREPEPRQLESHHCLSCMADLHDEHNAGVSDRYCRYCSDENGRLRPREEVHRILADWLGLMQKPITPEEALERASWYMKAMPAWADKNDQTG